MKCVKSLCLFFIRACIISILVIPVLAQEKLVEDLEMLGYKSVSKEQILEKIKTRAGEGYKEKQVKEDFQRVMEMGVFDKLRSKLIIEEGPRGGKIVRFLLTEQPANEVIEIILERRWTSCLNCTNYKLILRNEEADPFKDILVTYILLDSDEQRQGRLIRYHWNKLVEFIESQRYFQFKDAYNEGVEDTIRTTTSIVKGNSRKTIINQGNEPVALWAIESAIDGVLSRVLWNKRQK